MTISPFSPSTTALPFSSDIRIQVPSFGLPTGSGEYFSLISSVTLISVIAQVDSVGPYVLTTFAPGKRFFRRLTVLFVNISPQNKKSVRSGRSSPENIGSTRHTSAKEGVETHLLIPDRLNASYRSFISTCTFFPRAKSVPPVYKHRYRSITDKSKEKGA